MHQYIIPNALRCLLTLLVSCNVYYLPCAVQMPCRCSQKVCSYFSFNGLFIEIHIKDMYLHNINKTQDCTSHLQAVLPTSRQLEIDGKRWYTNTYMQYFFHLHIFCKMLSLDYYHHALMSFLSMKLLYLNKMTRKLNEHPDWQCHQRAKHGCKILQS